jgi:hypothetical protein
MSYGFRFILLEMRFHKRFVNLIVFGLLSPSFRVAQANLHRIRSNTDESQDVRMGGTAGAGLSTDPSTTAHPDAGSMSSSSKSPSFVPLITHDIPQPSSNSLQTTDGSC